MTYALIQNENRQIFDTFEELMNALPDDASDCEIEVLSLEDMLSEPEETFDITETEED